MEKDLLYYLPELTKPYNPKDIKWRVTATSPKGKALVVPYLDARHIQERLDEVVPGQWELFFRREPLEGGAFIGGHVVYATLRICGVTREDVGSSYITNTDRVKRSDNSFEKLDENKLDPKTATSDSIKRVAAQFGIARYLWKFDKKVWITNKDTFRFDAPSYEDIPQDIHEYLQKLGEESQLQAQNSVTPVDLTLYLLNLVKEGATDLDTLTKFISDHKGNAYPALVERYLKDTKNG